MSDRQTFAIGDTIRQSHIDAVDAMTAELASALSENASLREWAKGDNDAAENIRLRAEIAALKASMDDAENEAHDIGLEDGRSVAIQEIDLATGGDGEYRFCTDLDPERHTPDPDAMKARIVERFERLKASIAKEREDAAREMWTHCFEALTYHLTARQHIRNLNPAQFRSRQP